MNEKNIFDVQELSEFLRTCPSEAENFKSLLMDAHQYLAKFKWCKRINSSFIGGGVSGVYAVFLFEIKNHVSPEDDKLWVIIGDIPPAYLVVNGGPRNSEEALSTYIDLMGEWVNAVKRGDPVGDLIPVNVPPTPTYAGMLESRLSYLSEHFLSK